MKNSKVIVISGFARGGTNIVWNILQSHPEIVAPPCETGEIFKNSPILSLLNTRGLYKHLNLSSRIIDYILFCYKMKSFNHPDNRYRSEGTLYSRKQMEQSVLCLKSVNDDILITDLLVNIYPDIYFIGLTRNGYSLADGYVRRGQTGGKAGQLYHRIAMEMQRYAAVLPNFKIVSFEKVVQEPFEVAQDLFKFVGVHPQELKMLRLKSKRIINNEGEHNPAFGDEHRKYWFSRESISQIIDPDINQRQRSNLTDQMITEFNHEAESALRFFGYETY